MSLLAAMKNITQIDGRTLTVFSATAHRGGKMTKSAMATPGVLDFAVSTVKIDGS